MSITEQQIAQTRQQALRSFQSGNVAQAHAMYTALCRHHPNAETWYMLGIINGQLGRLSDAEYCCRQSLALQPSHSPSWDNLGIALMLQGRNAEAKTCFQTALKHNPRDEQACNALGNLLREEGRIQESVASFEKALRLKPDYAEALNNLGNIHKDRCLYSEARQQYRKALAIDPRYADALFNLGGVDLACGDYDSAIDRFRKVLELRPGMPEAVAAIAGIHEKRREYQDAAAILEPSLARIPVPAPIAVTYASIAPRIDRIDHGIEIVNGAISYEQSPILRQELLFKLGELLDRKGEHDKAFAAYHKANTIRRYPFDSTRLHSEMDSLKNTFSEAGLMRMPQSTCRSETPVFIVGMPRSGTTLVEQILASHPDVHGAGELPYMGEIVTRISRELDADSTYPQCLAHTDSKMMTALAEEYLGLLRQQGGDSHRITDKMPHNFLHLGLIQILFPDARVIHCMRTPEDTCLSIYFHNFNANHPYAGDLAALGEYYRAYRDLMHHWKEALRIPILDIQYEELVQDQYRLSREIVEFCGLDWNERCLNFHESDRVVSTPSYDQVRQPLYTGSVDRWKKYADHLKPLIEALGD